ncbi:MAG: radical SAM protein [Elusimicrobiota bacterium]
MSKKPVESFDTDKEPGLLNTLYQRAALNITRNPDVFMKNFMGCLRICLTYRCNLACHSCYAEGLQKEMPQEISPADMSRVLTWAGTQGWDKIRLLGGEPTVHPEFSRMLEMCFEEGFEVTMSTNNLYDQELLDVLDNPLLYDISVNYSIINELDETRKKIFRENLSGLSKRRIPFGFSHIITAAEEDDSCREIFLDASRFRPKYIRVSLELPAVSGETAAEDIFIGKNILFSKLDKMISMSSMMFIPFFIYRPLPQCLFSDEEWKKIKGKFPKICFARCPITYASEDGFYTLLTINPDLTVFPCPSVFLKGPEIFSFNNRKEIEMFYKKKLAEILKKPLLGKCSSCGLYANFIDYLQGNRGSGDTVFDDKNICQGGCANFKTARTRDIGCCQE